MPITTVAPPSRKSHRHHFHRFLDPRSQLLLPLLESRMVSFFKQSIKTKSFLINSNFCLASVCPEASADTQTTKTVSPQGQAQQHAHTHKRYHGLKVVFCYLACVIATEISATKIAMVPSHSHLLYQQMEFCSTHLFTRAQADGGISSVTRHPEILVRKEKVQ